MTDGELQRLYLILGKRIRAARERLPLSQTALAKKLKISRVSIVNIEKGRQRPPLHLLWNIAEHLGVEVSQFIPLPQELAESGSEVHLDPETIAKIEEAAKDPAGRRRLTEFIQMTKLSIRGKK